MRIAIEVGGRQRECLFRRPAIDKPALALMFHGTGGTATFAEDETGWTDLAQREQFAIAYPEGLPPRDDRPAKFLTNPPVWHDGSFGPGDFFEESNDLRFIDELLDRLIAEQGVDPNRVYATGFSNGAGFCFALATHMTRRLRAIAPVAGHCWVTPPVLDRPMPTIAMFGDADPLIPLAGGPVRTPWGWTRVKPSVEQTVSRWARAIGCGDWETEESSADVSIKRGRGPFEFHLIHGLGHHWPGGRGKLSEKFGGPKTASIKACQLIWDFFRQCDRR
jgi:polyhydroxybutyrate depolymerase